MGSPYQSQSASNYNSSPPPDDGSTVAANKITWAKIKTALADSIKTLADNINTALRAALNVSPSTTSIAYTTLVGDHLTTIEATGTFTVSLGDAATMIAQSMGYKLTVYNKGTGVVTVGVVTATDTLDGRANGTVTLPPGAAMTFTVAQSGVGYDIVSATGFSPVVLTGAAGTNTATANAPANLLALYSGLVVSWTPAATNTGALTLNITPSGGSALTAKNVFWHGAACSGGEATISVPTLLQYDGTQFNIIGLAVGTVLNNVLSGDVALNNTANFFDGPSVAQGTVGSWYASGSVTIADTAGAANMTVKLWDGTTVIASTILSTAGASANLCVHLSGYITSPAGNIRISVKDATSTSGKILWNSAGLSSDSLIFAQRIG